MSQTNFKALHYDGTISIHGDLKAAMKEAVERLEPWREGSDRVVQQVNETNGSKLSRILVVNSVKPSDRRRFAYFAVRRLDRWPPVPSQVQPARFGLLARRERAGGHHRVQRDRHRVHPMDAKTRREPNACLVAPVATVARRVQGLPAEPKYYPPIVQVCQNLQGIYC